MPRYPDPGPAMTCPFCGADHPQLVSQFGSQLLFSQYRCRACGSYFEGLRDDLRTEEEDANASE
jgi:transposase-like protein